MNQPCTVAINNYVNMVTKRPWKIKEWITNVRLILYSRGYFSLKVFEDKMYSSPVKNISKRPAWMFPWRKRKCM